MATAAPGVWDTETELKSWLQNPPAIGASTIADEGAAAVLRVDMTTGDLTLRGPLLDPAARSVSSGRIRYRWLGRLDGEVLLMTFYLRPVQFDELLHLPRLDKRLPFDLSQAPIEESGDWVEQDFVDANVNGSRPPYQTLFAAIALRGARTRPPFGGIHGHVDIDWIALFP
jgi:hypothetical protein